MNDGGEARANARPDPRERGRGVVRSLSRHSLRPCARPGCPSPAHATLSFRYDSREAWLSSLTAERDPNDYDLCVSHADKTRTPHGWKLVDDRPAEEPSAPRLHLDDDASTVALLAKALGRTPPGGSAGADDASPTALPPPNVAQRTPAPTTPSAAAEPSPVSEDPRATSSRGRAPLAVRDEAVGRGAEVLDREPDAPPSASASSSDDALPVAPAAPATDALPDPGGPTADAW